MSYCTHCGAADKACPHGVDGDDGNGPFCEVARVHTWWRRSKNSFQCPDCGTVCLERVEDKPR